MRRLYADHLPLRQRWSEGRSHRRQEDWFAQGYRPYRDLRCRVLIGSSHGGRTDEASEIGAITSCWREGIIVYFFRGEWSSGWSRLMSVSKSYTSFVSNLMPLATPSFMIGA